MTVLAVAHRDGMDFCGNLAEFALGLAGKTLEDVALFTNLMWGGTQPGDLAVLKDGLYYVCDGIDPDTGKPFTSEQLEEIKSHFGVEAVTVF